MSDQRHCDQCNMDLNLVTFINIEQFLSQARREIQRLEDIRQRTSNVQHIGMVVLERQRVEARLQCLQQKKVDIKASLTMERQLAKAARQKEEQARKYDKSVRKRLTRPRQA
jgi:hypothetical protein